MKPIITISETRDVETVWKIVHDPSVFDAICDDNWSSKPVGELKDIVRGIVENQENHVPIVFKDEEAVGCFICYAMGNGVFEIHTCLSFKCRGAEAIEAGKMATQYVLSLPDVNQLYSFCPANLPESYLFARLVGWKRAGLHTAKWVKHGIGHMQRIVQITKSEWRAQCL